jgi:hypothetical protein
MRLCFGPLINLVRARYYRWAAREINPFSPGVIDVALGLADTRKLPQ